MVSGNNRTMSAKLARVKYPARYHAYRDFLQEELSAFGIAEKDFADRTVFAGRDAWSNVAARLREAWRAVTPAEMREHDWRSMAEGISNLPETEGLPFGDE